MASRALFSGFKRTSDLAQVVNDRLHGDSLLLIAFGVMNVVPGAFLSARRTFSDSLPRGRGARVSLVEEDDRIRTSARAAYDLRG